MKKLLIIQTIVTSMVVALATVVASPQAGLSCFLGSFIVSTSLVIMQICLSLMAKKKLVALVFLLIVIKYAILGTTVYVLLQQPWLHIWGFSAGVGVVVVTAFIGALMKLDSAEATAG